MLRGALLFLSMLSGLALAAGACTRPVTSGSSDPLLYREPEAPTPPRPVAYPRAIPGDASLDH